MPRQFRRKMEVKVTKASAVDSLGVDINIIQSDTLTITDLDMTFKITKTFRKEPNTCDLIIFNLNPDHRGQIASDADTTVEISAGYEGEDVEGSLASAGASALSFGGHREPVAFGLLFSGDIRNVSSSYDNPDWVTRLESGDGEKSKRTARINRSFGPGTPLPIVLREAGLALGVGEGNLNLFALDPRNRLIEASPAFLHGITLSGNAWNEFDRMVKSAGLEWSIQDGKIQIARPSEALLDFSVKLTPDTGLIGSPTVSSKGIASMRALLSADIVPGRGITVESKVINGKFLARNCTYSGSTFGGDWYVDIEAALLEEGAGGLLSVVGAF